MKRVYVHPLPVRLWHWTNAFGFILLILTGLQIRYVGVVEVLSFRTAVNLHNYRRLRAHRELRIAGCFTISSRTASRSTTPSSIRVSTSRTR